MQQRYRRSSPAFDIDVNQDEPLLVDSAQKVLDESDVAALDLARRIEPEEIVKRITAIAEMPDGDILIFAGDLTMFSRSMKAIADFKAPSCAHLREQPTHLEAESFRKRNCRLRAVSMASPELWHPENYRARGWFVDVEDAARHYFVNGKPNIEIRVKHSTTLMHLKSEKTGGLSTW